MTDLSHLGVFGDIFDWDVFGGKQSGFFQKKVKILLAEMYMNTNKQSYEKSKLQIHTNNCPWFNTIEKMLWSKRTYI